MEWSWLRHLPAVEITSVLAYPKVRRTDIFSNDGFQPGDRRGTEDASRAHSAVGTAYDQVMMIADLTSGAHYPGACRPPGVSPGDRPGGHGYVAGLKPGVTVAIVATPLFLFGRSTGLSC
jgi:hypothetical protein